MKPTSERRIDTVGKEILQVLRRCGPMGILGLEDRCNAWRTPKELREALLVLVLAGRVKTIGMLPSGGFGLPTTPGAYLVYVA